jgi:hypothetical protein
VAAWRSVQRRGIMATCHFITWQRLEKKPTESGSTGTAAMVDSGII